VVQQLKYRGWVPTISGRLSFSVFGETSAPTKAIRANVADDAVRFLTVYQFRDTSDALLLARSRLAPYLFGLDGRLFFVFIAKTTDSPKSKQYFLQGKAFIFHKNKEWKNNILPAIKNFQIHLEEFKYPSQSLSVHAEDRYNQIIHLCCSSCVFHADVKISRTGTTDIKVSFPIDLPESAPKLPSDQSKFEHIAHVLASQIFFFVKDIGHRHQHHDPSTDQIVHLAAYNEADDHSWREKTLYSIYRRVIETKRQPHLATFSDSLGLIAYAEAFACISKEEIEIESTKETGKQVDDYKLPVYYAPQIIASIMSSRSRVERHFLLKQRKIDVIRNTVLSLAGLLLSFIGLLRLVDFKIQVEPHPYIVSIAKYFVTEPLTSFGILVLIVYAIVAIFSNTYADPPSWSTRIIRVLQPLSWSAFVGLLLIATAVSGVLFLWLLLA
jgi:hypothetical protein